MKGKLNYRQKRLISTLTVVFLSLGSSHFNTIAFLKIIMFKNNTNKFVLNSEIPDHKIIN